MPVWAMASPVATITLTTVDVYELASGIGNQFQKMIDSVGIDSITGLMPMVIRALESLEELTSKLESENTEICELRYIIERLQAEKKLKAEENIKFEKEVEQMEESWKKEAQSQKEIISKLQDENRRLNAIIQEHKFNENDTVELLDEYNELQEEIERLKVVISKQKGELRTLDKDLDQQINNSELLETKVRQLCRQNSESVKKSNQMERAAQNAIYEKSEIQTQLMEKDRLIVYLQEKIKRLEGNTLEHSFEEQACYQEIMKERDLLKIKVETLNKELSLHKSQKGSDKSDVVGSDGGSDNDDDAPVQGPINKEPDEKLYPEKYKKPSGIRRFFKNLLTPSKPAAKPMIPLRDPLQHSATSPSLSILNHRRSSIPYLSSSLTASQKCHPF